MLASSRRFLESARPAQDTVLILKDTLSCKEEDITAKNAQVVETMRCGLHREL